MYRMLFAITACAHIFVAFDTVAFADNIDDQLRSILERSNGRAVRQSFSDGRKIISVFFLGQNNIDVALTRLRTVPGIWSLSFSSCQLSDEGCSQLSGFGSLEIMQIYGDKLPKSAWDCLAKCKRLKSLSVLSGRVTESDSAKLKEMGSLQSLTMMNCELATATLKAISGLEDLQSLVLTGCNVTDNEVLRLARLRELIYLDLEGTNVTDKCCDQLSEKLIRCRVVR